MQVGADHRAEDAPSVHAPWRTRIGRWFQQHWALGLLTIAVVLTVLIYFQVLYHEADRPSREVPQQVWMPPSPIDSGGYRVELRIAYPAKLLLETSSATPLPVSIWLAVLTRPSGAGLAPPGPWTVALYPSHNALVFTNSDGVPIASRLELTPTWSSAAAGVLYLRRAPVAGAPVSVPLTVTVMGPGPAAATGPAFQAGGSEGPLLELESASAARLRRFWDLLWSPATPLLVLLTGCVGFGVDQFRLRGERTEKRKQQILTRVGELKTMSSSLVAAAHCFDEYRQRAAKGGTWDDGELREALEDTWRNLFELGALRDGAAGQLGKKEFSTVLFLTRLAVERDPDDELTKALSSVAGEMARLEADEAATTGATEIASIIRACLAVDGEYGHRHPVEGVRSVVARLLAELIARGRLMPVADNLTRYEYAADLVSEPEFEAPLREKQGEPKAQELLDLRNEAFRWLAIWPEHPPESSPALSTWLKSMNLEFNPFGPEVAEQDSNLGIYGHTAVFDQAQGKRPLVVFGEAGSGKTASALLLARNCVDPAEKPRESGAFPVYYVPPLNMGQATDRLSCLVGIGRAIAAAVARYLAHRCGGFVSLTPPRREGVSALLSWWAGSPAQLGRELRRLGPPWGTNERLIAEAIGMFWPQSGQKQTDLELMELLAAARPAGFDCFYVLIDVPSQASVGRSQAMAQAVRPFIDLAVPLGARQIYLKLFLPFDLDRYLGDLLGLDRVTLNWTDEALAQMIKGRFEQAGGQALSALFLPTDPSLDDCLIQVARRSPRRLIRAGNDLFQAHVREGGGDSGHDSEWALGRLQAWGARQ